MRVRAFVRDLRDKTFLGRLTAAPLKLLRAAGVPIPEALYKHFHFRGIVGVRLEQGNRMRIRSWGGVLENGLYWRGIEGYEPECLKVWCRLASTARVVIDVGANTGLYSLLAAATGPKARVHGFEPLDRIASRFTENVALNPGFNISIHRCAVSDSNGDAVMHDPGAECPSSASLDGGFLPSRESRYGEPNAMTSVRVPVRTLDSFEEFSRGDVDLIKIDSEGVEAKVLAGAANVIANSRPAILLEFLDGQEELGRSIAGLQALGYRLYQLYRSGPRFIEAPVPSPESWNVLLMPEEHDVFREKGPAAR